MHFFGKRVWKVLLKIPSGAQNPGLLIPQISSKIGENPFFLFFFFLRNIKVCPLYLRLTSACVNFQHKKYVCSNEQKQMRPMKARNPWNLWNHETHETTKLIKPRNLWNHESHKTYETIETTKPMKARNVCNHETFDTRKLWNHETTKLRKKPQNLLKYETYETTKPIKPICDETRHNSESFLTETNEHKQTWEQYSKILQLIDYLSDD